MRAKWVFPFLFPKSMWNYHCSKFIPPENDFLGSPTLPQHTAVAFKPPWTSCCLIVSWWRRLLAQHLLPQRHALLEFGSWDTEWAKVRTNILHCHSRTSFKMFWNEGQFITLLITKKIFLISFFKLWRLNIQPHCEARAPSSGGENNLIFPGWN